MRNILLSFFLLFAAISSVFAQELTVKSFKLATNHTLLSIVSHCACRQQNGERYKWRCTDYIARFRQLLYRSEDSVRATSAKCQMK